jgi:hypothetical protein
MEPVAIIVVVLILVALAAAAFFLVRRNQERFGPEYERAVSETGNRKEAEQHLAAVADKRDSLEVRDLEPRQRAQFVEQWELVQARFVDEPAAAVDGAELLITTVMHERGYPVEDFDERADLVAVDHPDVVEHYRAAHASHQAHRSSGELDTEDLRQAFVHYRALFDSLVGRADDAPASTAPEHLDTTDSTATTATDTADPTPDTTPDTPDQVQRADRTVDVTDDAARVEAEKEARR